MERAARAYRRIVVSILVGVAATAVFILAIMVVLGGGGDPGSLFGGLYAAYLLTCLACWITGAVSSLQLSRATGDSALWVGTFVPGVIGLIFAAIVVAQASSTLGRWGVPMGALGPRLDGERRR